MAMVQTHYEVLGVTVTASVTEITVAYRRLAMRHHPDRNGGSKTAEETFKLVKAAYEVLTDPSKRSSYDFSLRAGHSPRDSNPGWGQGAGFRNPFEDVDFGEGVYGAGYREPPREDRIIKRTISLTLEQAFKGCQISIGITLRELCDVCDGQQGVEVACHVCGGRGVVNAGHSFQRSCHTCYGYGVLVHDGCRHCDFRGYVTVPGSITAEVPANCKVGQIRYYRVRGEAVSENATVAATFKLKPHKYFTLEGNDLHVDVPVPYFVALFGGEIPVPTISGLSKMVIKPGTHDGLLYRKPGGGVAFDANLRSGDQVCHIKVEMPTTASGGQLTPGQLKALREAFITAGYSTSSAYPESHRWTTDLTKKKRGRKPRSG